MTRRALELTPKTRLDDLLKEYSFLIDFLADYKPELWKLRNPLMRQVMARRITLEDVASMGAVPFEKLACDLAKAIEQEPRRASEGNLRRETLKSIVKELHQGSRRRR